MCRGLTQAAHLDYLSEPLGPYDYASISLLPRLSPKKRRKISDIAVFRLISSIV